MKPPSPISGLLIVGHGTRHDNGARQFLTVAAEVARMRPDLVVEPAFLELRQPDIASAVRRLSERGCPAFVAVPLLLFAAGHAKEDIPRGIERATRQTGGGTIPWRLAGHLGNDPLLVELSEERFRETLSPNRAVPASETCLLLVGRGSSDAEAVQEMHALGELRRQQPFTRGAAGDVRVAFVAKAEPPLATELERLAASGYRRIVVQPHLLFEGEVADSIRRHVMSIAARDPGQEWLVTCVLASPLDHPDRGTEVLSSLVVARFEEAVRNMEV